ncbi:unnamed protein product [Boreogadus saida]
MAPSGGRLLPGVLGRIRVATLLHPLMKLRGLVLERRSCLKRSCSRCLVSGCVEAALEAGVHSKKWSSVTLDPNAHPPGTGAAPPSDRAAKDGESVSETAALGEGILMVQPVNSKTQGGGGARDHTAKGYLELGGKGSGGEGEAQMSREGGEEEEDEEGDVEELINFLDSEGSLHSELLD